MSFRTSHFETLSPLFVGDCLLGPVWNTGARRDLRVKLSALGIFVPYMVGSIIDGWKYQLVVVGSIFDGCKYHF